VFKNWLARFYLTLYFFSSNKLMNFAANLTFFFLLSFVPMLLIISIILTNLPVSENITNEIINMIKSVNPDLIEYILNSADKMDTLTRNALNFGVFGGVSLFLTSLLFVRALKAAFTVIFSRTDIKWGILGFFVPVIMEILAIVMLITVIVLKIFLNIITDFFTSTALQDFIWIINLLENVIYMPIVILFAISWLGYFLMSRGAMTLSVSLICSSGFCVTLFVFNKIFSKIFDIAYYSFIYGSLGTLIFGLFWVYIVFCLFLFWGQMGYVFHRLNWITVRMYIESRISRLSSFMKIISMYFLSVAGDKIRFLDKNDYVKVETGDDYIFIGDGAVISDGGKFVRYTAGDLIESKDCLGKKFKAEIDSIIVFLSKEELVKFINESQASGNLIVRNFI